jgi:hypothetical protein
VNFKTLEIIATAFGAGSEHDFHLFKESRSVFAAHIRSLADSGYLGINHLHKNSQIPAKKSKLHPLSKEQKNVQSQLIKGTHIYRKRNPQVESISHFD